MIGGSKRNGMEIDCAKHTIGQISTALPAEDSDPELDETFEDTGRDCCEYGTNQRQRRETLR